MKVAKPLAKGKGVRREAVVQFLEGTLKLKVNREKSAVDRPSRRKFLGFSFYRYKGEARIRLAPKSLKRVRADIRAITSKMARSLDAEPNYGPQRETPGLGGLR